ncbi:hypothetical protein [Caenimonas aquaedulcis]|uniref:Uncharacterized protein n=1 Tax=Caenimonas aquaedulcis TaxID=2793270 RepID=A0A931H7G2_9BURK|nr:hypothetical protein [Caenimonas aquaedulcis]MBG9390085.1 hypothetical protein [Caenimonas aquaedulcis]
MITDIECRSEIGPELDRAKLNPYWAEYFAFVQDARSLHALAESALQGAIDAARGQPRPYIDSQQVISEILTRFGSQHNFHRQFNEAFAAAKPSQVLGMHLYELVARDSDWWVYFPTQHVGHAFPHATYFMPKEDARFQRLLRRHAA